MYPDSGSRRGGTASAIFAAVALALICYLGFAALQGEHGLFSLFRTEAEEARLKAELGRLQDERERIANKTRRLSTGHIDPDLLDEQARRVLGLGRPDEIMIR
jgi:cell division protein FtsB